MGEATGTMRGSAVISLRRQPGFYRDRLRAYRVRIDGNPVGEIAAGNTEPGGALPLNTNGGGLSYTHTGMYGMFAIQEGVRQIRGEAAAQVDGPDISVVLGNGGMFATSGVLVLGRQPR